MAKLEATTKRRDIQGLRGLAITYVLIFHLYPKLFPHGFLGVDIFFVISGFLITMILQKKQQLTSSIVMVFFMKRIKRIFPAYFLVLFLTLFVGFFILASTDYALLKKDALWALGFATNFHKYFQNMDYFAQVSNFDFVLHTWSLAVEIQFYIIAPILILFSKNVFCKYAFCGTVFIGSIYFNIAATGPLQFSSLLSRIWQFICGSIAFMYPTDIKSTWIISIPLLLISPLTIILPLNDTVLRFIVTAASALIISANNALVNSHLLGNSILYFIGEISYSVYLFHWPVILFLKYSSNLNLLLFSDAVIAAEISIIFGYLSYKFIEKFFLEARFFYTVIFLVLSASAIAYICCLNFSSLNSELPKNQLTDLKANKTVKSRFAKACYQFMDVPYLPVSVTDEMRKEAIRKNKFYRSEKIPVLKSKYHSKDPFFKKHFTDPKAPINYHDYYKGNGSLSIIVFGNSFAHSGFLAVFEAFNDHIKEIRLVSNSACQPFLNSTKYAVGEFKRTCPFFIPHALNLIDDVKPDIVFLLFKPHYGLLKPVENIETDEQMIHMQETIDRLSLVTKVILIQMPLPAADKGYTDLLLKILERKQSFDGLYMDFPAFRETYRHASLRLEHLKCDKCVRIYGHRIFCDAQICRVFDPDNLITFYDHSFHFNSYAQQCLSRLYKDTLLELLADKRFDKQ